MPSAIAAPNPDAALVLFSIDLIFFSLGRGVSLALQTSPSHYGNFASPPQPKEEAIEQSERRSPTSPEQAYSYLIANTPPPPPPQCRILLNRHNLLLPLSPPDPASGLDIPPRRPAAHHSQLSEGSKQRTAASHTLEDQHVRPDGGNDVQVTPVPVDGVAEDGPHAGGDAGADGGG